MAALVTVAEYKTYAGITGSGDDAVLTVLIDAASAAVRRACGRHESTGFASATYTETIDGTGADTISLVEWPVSSVTSIKYIDDNGVETTIAATAYRVNLATGVVYMLGSGHGRSQVDSDGYMVVGGWGWEPKWTQGFGNYQAVYVGGYSPIPSDLAYAVFRLVDIMFAERRQNPNLQSESLGAYSYARASVAAGAAAASDSEFDRLIAPFKSGRL